MGMGSATCRQLLQQGPERDAIGRGHARAQRANTATKSSWYLRAVALVSIVG